MIPGRVINSHEGVSMKSLLRFGVLAAALAVFPALLVNAAPPPPSVGIVDVDAVDHDYKGFTEAQTYWNSYQEQRQNSYAALAAGQYLLPAEFDELQRLSQQKVVTNQARLDELNALAKKNEEAFNALMDKVKANLSPEDQARMEQLRATPQYSQDTAKEMDELVAKGKDKLSDADKASLQAMEDNQGKVLATIGDIVDKLRTEMDAEKTRLIKVLTDQMDAAIAKVAKDQNISIVLNKNLTTQQGSQQLVLWGGTDITEKVVKFMNDSFKPEILTPPAAPAAATPAPVKPK